MNYSDIPVIILNWNGWDDTIRCIRSIVELGQAYNIWVVDNGSAVDRSAELLEIDSRIAIMKTGENRGWSGGCNMALRKANGLGHAFAYLLNNDTIVHPQFLEAVMDAALRDDSLAAVGSRIAFWEPSGYLRFDGSYYRAGQKKICATDEVCYTEVANGAGMLVRLEAMHRHGYFDERYFIYGDESEWCRRMLSHGLRVGVHGASLVIHKGAGTDSNSTATYYRIRNRFLFHSQQGRALPDVVVQLASGLAKSYLKALADGKERRAYVQAFGDGADARFGRRADTRIGFARTVKFDCALLIAVLCRILQRLPGGKKVLGSLKLDVASVSLLRDSPLARGRL